MKVFNKNISKSANAIAVLSLLGGLYFLFNIIANSHNYQINLIPVLFGVVYLVGGYFALKGYRWAFGLLFISFLVQIIKFRSVDLIMSFQNGIGFYIQTYTPDYTYSLNILPIVLTYFSWNAFSDLKQPSSSGQMSKSKRGYHFEP